MKVRIFTPEGVDARPTYATKGSAGMDIRANETISMPPNSRRLIKTGIHLEIPEGFEAQIRPRSGMCLKQGITVLNAPGTIDSDYRGEVGVILANTSNIGVLISKGMRIAQMVFAKYERVEFEEALTLSETERGEEGFGSTGH